MFDDPKPPVETIQHANGIHEIIFHESTRAAINSWTAYCATLYTEMATDATGYMLIDMLNIPTLPIDYVVQRRQWLLKSHPQRPHFRCAYLMNLDALSIDETIATTFLGSDTPDETVRFFRPVSGNTRRHDAIVWLLHTAE